MFSRRNFLVTGTATTISFVVNAQLGFAQNLLGNRRFVKVEELTQELFAAHLHSKFQVRLNDRDFLELELTNVTARAPLMNQQGAKSAFEKFALLFQGPPSPRLPQQIHRFQHAVIGGFEIFIVPVVSPDAGKPLYEAVFTRLVKI